MLKRSSVVLAGTVLSVAGLVFSGTGGVAAAPASATTTVAASQSPSPSSSSSPSAAAPQPSQAVSTTPSPSITCTMAPPPRPTVTGATATTLTISFFVYGGICGTPLPVRFALHEEGAGAPEPVAELRWDKPGSGTLTFEGLTPDTEYYIRTDWLSSVVWARTAALPASCTATVKIDSSWSGGFVATVAVRNVGTVPLHGWRVSWPRSARQSQVIWNAVEESADGATVTVRNAPYNAVVAAAGATTFGMVVWTDAAPAGLAATCGA
ncbi:MAG TPA: cellulose binding domain-containing protein [Actinoplanes sp.]|nr:cellulose binding domain-containing protein [Actinoplanes sp.]